MPIFPIYIAVVYSYTLIIISSQNPSLMGKYIEIIHSFHDHARRHIPIQTLGPIHPTPYCLVLAIPQKIVQKLTILTKTVNKIQLVWSIFIIALVKLGIFL